MSAPDQIPASSLLGHALDDAILARETTIRVLHRQNAQLLAIVLILLAIVAGFGATAFSLVVRNNLVILPDRAKKAISDQPSAVSPARSSISHLPSPRACRADFRRLDPAKLGTWCAHRTPAGGGARRVSAESVRARSSISDLPSPRAGGALR